ncbi:hypothetical protein [Pseudomonas sp. LB3P14]
MLFMHKGSENCIQFAVYTGENPKGNEAAYELIDGSNQAGVRDRAQLTFNLLDIDASAHAPMLDILAQWIRFTEYDRQQADIYKRMSPEGMQKRKEAGINAEWRYYNNYIDLVLALFGEHLSKPTLAQETEVAGLVLSSERIRALVSSVSQKISTYAQALFDESERDKLLKGAYASLHPSLDWSAWVSGFADMSTEKQVPFLYDITMSFKKKLDWSEQPMDLGRITKDNMRINVSTPNEDFYWTSQARWAAVPIWAAPSYTTQLMLLVAKNAKATVQELQAFAYAIFAYWCKIYPHTATPIHRMYGVMTAAREFEVPVLACAPDKMYLQAMLFMNPQ